MMPNPSARPPIVRLVVAAGVLVAAIGLSPWTVAQSEKHDHGHGEAGKNPENWVAPNQMHLYLCAFHIAKENPSFQIEAHHYCSQHRTVHQCVIYDRRDADAKLLGVEYIIGDEAYRTLPDGEKKYWHPHAYEIMAGHLVAPDLADQGDGIFPGLINTWGKTWHTWRDPQNELPIGEPLLMWSANGDGQISEGLIAQRDAQFKISTDAIRKRRASFGFPVPNIPPPRSVNDLGRTWTPSGPDKPNP